MDNENKKIVIVAPHVDDETIGCFTIISKETENDIFIVYSSSADSTRRDEALSLKAKFEKITAQFFLESIPPPLLNPINVFYFPDPAYEFHPLHRHYGAIGEQLLRAGFDVTFYSINMQTPYIFEVEDRQRKKELLDEIYPSQKELWNHDHKYFLFEGHCKWLVKGRLK